MLRGSKGHTLQINTDGTIAAPTPKTHEKAVRALSAAILRVGYDAVADGGDEELLHPTSAHVPGDQRPPVNRSANDEETGASAAHAAEGPAHDSSAAAGNHTSAGKNPQSHAIVSSRRARALPRQLSAKWAAQIAERVVRLDHPS